MSVGYYVTLADELLSAAEDALVEATTGHPPPGNTYVSHGPPHLLDHCCESGVLAVHLEEVEHRNAGDMTPYAPSTGWCAIQCWPRFVITLGRCSPTFDDRNAVPSPGALDAAASDLLIDLWAILTELYDRMFACTLFATQTICEDVEIGNAVPLEAEGGCAGWEVRVAVGCNDAGPTGS